MLAELGLGRLSKFAHALDLSKLRAGAISAPELRALGLSTHEIDRLLAWARGQASDSPLFKLRYGQGSPHKQSVLAPVRESAPAAPPPPPPAMAKAGGKMLLRHAKKKASPRPALGVAKELVGVRKAGGGVGVKGAGVFPLRARRRHLASSADAAACRLTVERQRARSRRSCGTTAAVGSPPVLLSGTANAAASSALVALHELQISEAAGGRAAPPPPPFARRRGARRRRGAGPSRAPTRRPHQIRHRSRRRRRHLGWRRRRTRRRT